MLEKIARRLETHRETVEAVEERLQNYIYMAALLSYEAALRGDRLYIYGEGRSYLLALYFAQRLRSRFPDLECMAMRNRDDDTALFRTHLKKGDLFMAISTQTESAALPDLIELCRDREAKSVGLCARENSEAMRRCDVAVTIASYDVWHVDEMHLLVCNIIADAIEEVLGQA